MYDEKQCQALGEMINIDNAAAADNNNPSSPEADDELAAGTEKEGLDHGCFFID